MKLLGKLEQLVELVFRKGLYIFTVKPNQSTVFTANRTYELPPGDANQEIVGTSGSQTLTGKSISGATNTLSSIPNSATTATSSNTVSTIVARDASGNFAAGTITGNVTGNVSGTAGNITATTNNTLTTLSALSLPVSQITSQEVTVSSFNSSVTYTSGFSATTNIAASSFTLTAGTWLILVPGVSTLSLATYPLSTNRTINASVNLRNTTASTVVGAANATNWIIRDGFGNYKTLVGNSSFTIAVRVKLTVTSSFILQHLVSGDLDLSTNNVTHLIASDGIVAFRIGTL
jgi:hypothetical protein